ncbi:alpha/beta fold hydrolase [Paenibacillus donghaensis]|uniref:alpha/beta fold hydrolase n=1 Tax=Paenibacillus donghaensis TaxID=414771 RepID=UPI0012F85A05|nr:alpha/beta hydrolase [Paenibacillus donghaensis]
MKSYFIRNEAVVLHILENGVVSEKSPSLLIINGLWESAERAIPLLSKIQGHVVTFSFRGRGLSSTPENNYNLVDHLSDIEAVISYCGLKNYCVLGFSRGAAYAIGWSLSNQKDMCGLILVDQAPIHRSVGKEALDFWSKLVYLQVPILNHMRLEALQGLGNDADEVDFSEQLSKLHIPVALFAGRNAAAKIPSDISEETLKIYKESIPGLNVIEFQNSGHMIPDEEQQKYIEEIGLFLKKLV